MDAVIRALTIYVVLMVIFRIAGQRSLTQITTFDFVLLLVIGEATQQALLGNDFSVTNAIMIIITLVGIDIALSEIKQHSKVIDKWIDGVPVIVVDNGKPLKDSMNKVRVDEFDILTSARELQGLERMDQIKYAVVERNGGITIVPMRSA